MNIKRDLKKVSVILSVLWMVWVLVNSLGEGTESFLVMSIGFGVSGLIVWWGLLYTGFWVSSCFGDDDKNEVATNEPINIMTTQPIGKLLILKIILIAILPLTYLFFLWEYRLVFVSVIKSYL